jgi:nucleotide-binding universal stress UspA family protein
MGKLSRILVATDFSPASAPAVAEAVKLAREAAAELLLVYAYEPPGAATFGGYIPSVSLSDEIEQALRTGGQRSLEPLVEDARRQGVRATGRVLRGVPYLAITQAAAADRSDLIVLGTHGFGALSRFLLGSVAQRVIATAHCPVMTVRPLEEGKGETGKGRGPRRRPAGRGE